MPNIKFQDIPVLPAASVTGSESVALLKQVGENYYTYTLPINDLLYTDALSSSSIKNGTITSNKLSLGGPTWTSSGYFATTGNLIDLGNGINSRPAVITLGYNRTADGDCYVKLYSNSGTDHTSQISRLSGTNGNLTIENVGTGVTTINQKGSGSFAIKTNNTTRISISSNGNTYINNVLNISNETPETSLWLTSNQINAGYNYNGVTALAFNYRGYSNGTSKFRDTYIYDGKENVVATFTGSSKNLTVVGTISSNNNVYGKKLTGTSLDVSGNATIDGDLTIGDSKLSTPDGSAPIFGARAWVVFNATKNAGGTTDSGNTSRFIRNSGNVSSVVKLDDGKYQVNFTVALPNNDYALIGTSNNEEGGVMNSASAGIINRFSQEKESAIVLITDPTNNTYQNPDSANIVFFC